MDKTAFPASSASTPGSACKIAQPRKSKPRAHNINLPALADDEPSQPTPQEDADMAVALELMKLSDNAKEQPHRLTEEELTRQSCPENLTAILAKLLVKCKASGDTLNAGIDVSTLVADCESNVWQGTYGMCGDIDVYAEAMALEQTDFETWYPHWDLEEDGRSLFLEYVHIFHGQTLTPSLKREVELGRVRVGEHPLFTDDAGAVKFTSRSKPSEKIKEKIVKPADDVKEEEDDLLAAVLEALDEGDEEVAAVMEALERRTKAPAPPRSRTQRTLPTRMLSLLSCPSI